jgi:hypothetical protein
MGSSSRSILLSIAVMFTVLGVQGISSSKVVGSGYKLVSIHDSKSGDGVVAFLEVIKETPETLGKDIKRLKLVARLASLGYVRPCRILVGISG